MTTRLRLATRRSALALSQARAVATAIAERHPEVAIEEVLITTSGDRFTDQPLQDIGGKGLFLKEIELALQQQHADIAVHSIKDVPVEIASGLLLAAIPARADPCDVLVARRGGTLAALPRGARVGTSSLRRRTHLLAARPDLDVVPLRGNVDTRLRKVDEGQVDAVVLAAAGLERLGLGARATERLAPDRWLPAVGQGALAIECRAADETVVGLVAELDDEPSRVCVTAERAFMDAVEGSCRLPVAAFGVRQGDELYLSCLLAAPDGTNVRRSTGRAPFTAQTAAELGQRLGHELRAR